MLSNKLSRLERKRPACNERPFRARKHTRSTRKLKVSQRFALIASGTLALQSFLNIIYYKDFRLEDSTILCYIYNN